MQLRAFLFFFFFGFTFSIAAQNYTGVWEGYFYMGNRKQKMNVLIEIAQKDSLLVAVVTTRGLEKNTVYGCDYVLAGRIADNKLILSKRKVQRTIATDYYDCAAFRRIELLQDKKNGFEQLKCKWVWDAENIEEFVVKQTGTEISESAKDEISKGLKGRGDAYDEKKKKERADFERMYRKVAEVLIENKETTITVSLIEKTANTTVTVLLNSKPMAEDFNLSANELDIHFKLLKVKAYHIDIMNTSDHKRRLQVKIVLQQGDAIQEWTTFIEPDGNAWLLLKRKEE